MKLYFGFLACVLLVPVAFGSGYAVNQDPAPLTLSESLAQHLRTDAEAQTQYVHVVTKGQYQGDTHDAAQILSYTDAELQASLEAWIWQKAVCTSYSTSGDPDALGDPDILTHCKVKEVTRAEVERGVRELQENPAGVPVSPPA